MLRVTKINLKILSAIVWIIGGISLLLKGIALFKQAFEINQNLFIIVSIVIISIIVGMIKSKYIMSKFCIKNLNRIYKISNPRIYQFFELKFFIFLFLMISLGALLSKLAIGNYSFLLAIGCLDLALSTALLTSSKVFFIPQENLNIIE